MPDKERRDREEEESSGFKVVDRRQFTSEGERRPDAQPEAPPQKENIQTQPAANAGAKAEESPAPPKNSGVERSEPDAEAEAPTRGEHYGPVSFSQLVMSLATTAMFQLGLVQGHEGERPRTDLPAAKESIDLLDILQQKTKGNLTREEAELLEGSLYDLRMAFVELSRAGRVH